jgi:Rieske Fe-S protein
MDDEPTVAPAWKRDFPYEVAAEEDVTRREFARYLVAGAGVMAAGNLGIAAWTQLRTINTGAPRELIPLGAVAVGATHLFRYPTEADPAILLRVADREVVAFSQKCTHLGCVVYFEADEDRWHCPCHEGNFEPRTGAVISGPPSRPLGRIEVEIRDDTIWALGYQP